MPVLLKIIKIMLLLYLLPAVLLPSYRYSGGNVKTHFFSLIEQHVPHHHHSVPEMEAPHTRHHSHAVIHYYPGQRQQNLNAAAGNALPLLFTDGSTALAGATVKSRSIYAYRKKIPPDIFAETFSGLSPPLC